MFNFIKRLLNPKIKIMEKLQLMVAMHAFYAPFKGEKDVERIKALKSEIDAETDKLLGIKTTAAPVAQKTTESVTKEVVKAAAEATEKAKTAATVATAKATEEKSAAPVVENETEENDKVYDILPFYPCQIKTSNGKFFDVAKPPKAFTIAEDEETQKLINNAYPTMDEFDMIMDEAWELACKGMSAKDLNVFLKKNLEGWYKDVLKGESDYYTKLSNPICAAVSMIKKAFGQHPKDINVMVTRPDGYQDGKPGVPVILESKSDMTITKPAVEEKKPEPKAEMKTVQTGKAAPKAAEVIDEEAQETTTETEENTTEAETTEAAPAEEATPVAKGDGASAPAVNPFDKFNDFENTIAEKFIEGEKLANAAKTEEEKKAIRTNKREESRMLIQSWFEDQPWVESTPDGKWNIKLISYHNDLLKQITANRAKWPK